MSGITTRDQIIEAADELFYRHGFDHTSFADIAAEVKISRGNFYYHFRTKDEILEAVIEHRLAERREMLEKWEVSGETPAKRIRAFIDILIANRAKIKRSGCPIGTLSSELAKLNHPGAAGANRLFTLFRTWLARQFAHLGFKNKKADDLAMHVLARSQGVATLANAFQDDRFIDREVGELYAWLDSILSDAKPLEPKENI